MPTGSPSTRMSAPSRKGLRSAVAYSSGSGTVTSLADIGITLDSKGHLSLDSTALAGKSIADVQKFLGTVTSGGFLQGANSVINSLENPSTGAIEGNLTSIQSQITNQNKLISNETNRIIDLETHLQKQLSDADAAIALLQQQLTFMTGLFSTMFPNSNSSKTGGA